MKDVQQEQDTQFQRKSVEIKTEDGWLLTGDLTAAADPTSAVLISAGTGFPKFFYHALADFLAARGALVLTYDYRGIGKSAVPDLRNSGIDYPDWGHYDMPAALDFLHDRATSLPIFHIAHSVGGHFVGLMKNQNLIRRHAFLSVGTGYFGGHHLRNWPLELYFWWGLGQYSLMRWGYLRPGGGWQGEALPPKLFRTWRRWSCKRSYFERDYGSFLDPQYYSDVTAPIRSWVFTDDPIATERSGWDLLQAYPKADRSLVIREPSAFGVRRIGHEGAFRPGRQALWQECWDWLNQDGEAQSAQ
ncbi:Alpha/beta hydrolase [Roseobacter sp. SK209-2-6]|uniref:alpha/beta hydrolase family protein n=1 Tax=Roseobacter sp. SK209-2-6 TaxID=388739 RepID=UPI0000F3F6B8|nr:alpha/beta hydrolase [Roseobacter sp. SK209-2-6]EBA17960.1 Alpha/beta hydrolase [Roseobacter sp. SK209-2-6]